LNPTELRRQIGQPLYRNSLFLMGNTVVLTGLGFVFWIVVARFYTEAEVGLGSAIISSVMLLALVSGLGLDAALIRFLPKAARPVDMVNSCFTLVATTALVVSGIFIAGLPVWSPAVDFIRVQPLFILAFVLFAACWPLAGLMGSVFVARRKAQYVLVKSTIFSLLKLPLAIVLAIFFHAFGIVASWGVAVAIALVVSAFFLLPRVLEHYKPAPRLDLGIVKGIWKYSAGNYFASLFAAAPLLALPIIVVNIAGAEQNAHFYVAWMIGGLLFAISTAVSQSLFAEGSHFEEELPLHAQRAFRFALLLLVPGIALVVLLGKWLLLLFGESYSSSALTLLQTLGFSSIFVGVNTVYFSMLLVRGQIGELTVLRALTAVAVLVASALAIPALGINGVGYVWIGIQGLVSIYVLLRVTSPTLSKKLRQANREGRQK